jgi:hypothetical protein
MDLQVSVVLDETKLSEPVHKKTHARPRRSDHFGERLLWLTFAMTGSGRPSLPKFAIRRSNLARRFSLELNSWSTRSASTRAFRDKMYARNISENFGSSWSTRTMAALSNLMMTQSVIAAAVAKRNGWPLKQPSPKKSSLVWIATTASLPNSDMTLSLTWPSWM